METDIRSENLISEDAGRDGAVDVQKAPDPGGAGPRNDAEPKARKARRSAPKGPGPAPDVRPPGEPDGFDPFDPKQVAAAPQMAEILGNVDPDRPLIYDRFPVTNFILHPGGCLGTFPFVGIPEKDGHSFQLVDPRITKSLSARGALIKTKRLYRAMTWNPDTDEAECLVVRGAPATPSDHTAGWMLDLDRVLRCAQSGWVNVNWSQKNKKYRIAKIRNAPDPVWRDVSARDFVADAFEGKMINSPDHPLLAYLENYAEVDPE